MTLTTFGRAQRDILDRAGIKGFDDLIELQKLRELLGRIYKQQGQPFGSPFWVVGRMQRFYK